MEVSDKWLNEIKATMPALPRELYNKYIAQLNLPEYDAQVLTDSKDVALYFEELCKHTSNYKAASNWVMGPVKSHLNELPLSADEFPIPAAILAELISLVDSGKISFSVASQRIFPELLGSPNKTALEVAQQLNLIQESNHDAIIPIIDEVLKEFPLKVEEYKNGKKGIVGMFMGEVMKRSKGKADPKVANELITKKLEKV
jgi:aspartyl-tRNA(Asn)/glutamyl-tRNA(Gln) amidotransferase subunit B